MYQATDGLERFHQVLSKDDSEETPKMERRNCLRRSLSFVVFFILISAVLIRLFAFFLFHSVIDSKFVFGRLAAKPTPLLFCSVQFLPLE